MNSLTLLPKVESVAIELGDDFKVERERLITQSTAILKVSDEFSQEDAVDALRGLKQLIAAVEDSRVDVKAPVLTLGRKIDSIAKEAVEKLESEFKRVNGLLKSFTDEQEKTRAAAEQARIKEEQRIESERQKAAQAVADAEAARLRAVTPMEKKVAAVAVTESQQTFREAVFAKPITVVAPMVAKADGMTVKKVWKFKEVDKHKVYAFSRTLCTLELSARAINAAIANGERNIPGLEIWQETETGVKL